ncbi:SDR family oxidoreductase [Sphingobium sp. HBC34]|uniref:SDR family oxidoreductase n=1 Tax=Sphingobium cyanobacteriorum TaxID=3063954 RepID=A0ABT8ZGM7_9SPHN|nr:SDR family oxidoreductase [Sphingobium sp. HBC34]MDO7833478.1 SDR family oxidoreductase [Sphingobium sp. HBC34]
MKSLEGMVAVVVGAANGIGRVTALMLAERGAKLVLGDLSVDGGLQECAADIAQAGGQAIMVAVDHTIEAQVEALAAKAVAEFGKINILVNNAAGTSPAFQAHDRDVVTMSVDLWDRAMAVNLRGPMLTCKHVIPHMIAAGYGSIVNTSSGVTFRGDSVRTAYAASKIGIHSLTMDIATAYGKHNVRCNAVSPGLILTDGLRQVLTPEQIDGFAEQNLTPFVGGPEDIAEVTCFLASPAARYVTGQIIPVDGGMHVHQHVIGQG